MDARKTIGMIKKMKFPLLVLGFFMLLTVVSIIFGAGSTRKAPLKKKAAEKNDTFFVGKNSSDSVRYGDFAIDPEKKEKKEPKPVKRRPPVKRVARKVKRVRRIGLPPIVSIYNAPPKPFEGVSENYAPYGRLLECQLVMTIDSASTATPIIGMVTRDLWHDGKLIIPAGAEVHGSVTGKPVRDRVMSAENWVVVWRERTKDNGLELKLKGIALTLEAMYTPNSWNVYDGSAGIRGEIIKSTKMQELVAYAADFLAEFTDQLVQEQVTITDWGQTSTNSGSTSDAFNKGISSAVRKYADKLLDEINRNGYFVRCTGGTRFYLYVKQTIDLEKATIAATKIKDFKRRIAR